MTLAASLYNALMLPLSVLAYPLFSLHPRGKIRLAERYGTWNLPPDPYLWFHGASMGEMQGLLPLIRFVRERYPAQRILITSTSPTGLAAAEQFGHELRLLPFDCQRWLDKALGEIQCRGLVFGETELWPTFINSIATRKIPLCLVNARISDATAKWYARLRFLMTPVVRSLSCVCAGDENTLLRLLALGVEPAKIRVTGNAKFDKTPLIADPNVAFEIRQLFITGSEPVVTLGSIHPEEASIWIAAIHAVLNRPIRFVIAPRHSEKFEFFCAQLKAAGIPFGRRSTLKDARLSCQEQVLLLDTFGELESVYSFSTAAFIGGTIKDIGGHNPLEAAMYGVWLAAGQSRWNIRQIADELVAHDALVAISNAEDCKNFIDSVLRDPAAAKSKGQGGVAVSVKNRGATERTIAELRKLGVLPG